MTIATTTQRRNDATTQRRNNATTQRRNDATTTQQRNNATTMQRRDKPTTDNTLELKVLTVVLKYIPFGIVAVVVVVANFSICLLPRQQRR